MWQIHTYSKPHFDVSIQNIHATCFIKKDLVLISLYIWFKWEKIIKNPTTWCETITFRLGSSLWVECLSYMLKVLNSNHRLTIKKKDSYVIISITIPGKCEHQILFLRKMHGVINIEWQERYCGMCTFTY